MKTMEAGKPRALRGVVRSTLNKKTGRYKRAKDTRTRVLAECVKSRSVRPCASQQCIYPDGLIHLNAEYVKVTDPEAGRAFRIKNRVIITPLDYHPDCVPAHAFSLVRFIIPMRWVAYSCTEWQGPVTGRLFTSPEAWLLFTDKHYPSMRQAWSTNANFHRPPPYQVGTGYGWSQLFKV